MANAKEEKVNAGALETKLKSYRETAYYGNRAAGDTLLEILNYKKEYPYPLEAFLIKAIQDYIGVCVDADVVLMALRLLRGYDKIVGIGNRRAMYLKHSDFLRFYYKEELEEYNKTTDSTERDQKFAVFVENLRKKEDKYIKDLSNSIAGIEDIAAYLGNVGRFIKRVSLPNAPIVFMPVLPPASYQYKAGLYEKQSGETTDTPQEARGIVEMIKKSQDETRSDNEKIIEKLGKLIEGRETAATAADLPLFIASSFWFSRVSSKNEKNQTLYRNGYDGKDAVVLLGKSGNGKFAVVSSEYVFMENRVLLNDVPNSQDDMVIGLLSALGSDFKKKRIGLSTGHGERVTADSFSPALKQRLTLLDIDVSPQSPGKISGCNILSQINWKRTTKPAIMVWGDRNGFDN